MLYLPAKSRLDAASPTIIIIITTLAPLISYLPAYRVLRSVNRASLLAISTFAEGVMISIAAISLDNWKRSTCEAELDDSFMTPRRPSHWVAVICVLTYQQILFAITMPATLCNAMQTMRVREAPVALLSGIVFLWIPSFLSQCVSYIVAISHGNEVLCGASGRLIGLAMSAFIASMASFFCIDNSKTLRESPYASYELRRESFT